MSDTEAPVVKLDRCRFCHSEMPAGARLCKSCEQFQRLGDRVLNTLNVSVLIALIPTVTLAVTFLNQNLVRARSDLAAVISRCTLGDTTLALSNSGSRSAIIEGAEATLESEGPTEFVRSLRAPGEGSPPVVIKAGETAVVRFTLVDTADFSLPLEMPVLPPPSRCAYRVNLHVLDFGGRRSDQDLGVCKC